MKKKILKGAFVLLIFGVLAAGAVTGASLRVLAAAKPYILPEAELEKAAPADCVLVLGAGLRKDGSPTEVLADRIDTGIRVYESGVSDRLLMSGDHGRKDHDEVNAMKAIAVARGVPADSVFCDHAGFSTYESMYRASDIFGAEKIVIVTQRSHLPRAVYDARRLGIEAYGVASDQRAYANSRYQNVREFLARAKDFVWCIFKPEPTYRGEKIPLSGSGSLTDG